MNLNGFEFIKGKIVPRNWGIEYRFTASHDETKREYNEIVMLKTGKETGKEIEPLIQKHLDRVSSIPESEPEHTDLNDVNVKEYLVQKGYINKETELTDLKNIEGEEWLQGMR